MFHKTLSKDEAKRLYYRLSMFLHPDKGGECDLFNLLSESYEKKCMDFDENIQEEPKEKKAENPRYEGNYQAVYDENITILDPRIKVIDEMLTYAKENKNFKSDFIQSVYKFGKERGYITSMQYNSLLKTYYSFQMHIKKEPEKEKKKRGPYKKRPKNKKKDTKKRAT